MNDSTKRFLALNAVLQGHDMLEVFNGGIEEAAACLETQPDKLGDILRKIAELEEKGRREYNDIVLTVLNLMRSTDYSFIAPKNCDPIFLSSILEEDRQGDIDDALRDAIVLQLIRKFVVGEKDTKPHIQDGALIIPEGVSKEVLKGYLSEAYRLYKDGPLYGQGKVLKYREQLTLAFYKTFAPAVVRSILEDFVKKEVAPTDFTRTTLIIPDLLPVWKECGCVMSIDPMDKNQVYWLLDVEGKEASRVMQVEKAALAPLIIESSNDLANIIYSPKAAASGYLVPRG